MRILLLLICGLAAYAVEFRVGAGLTNFQVFQRSPQNTATIKTGGSADGLPGKSIEARVLAAGRPLKGWNWKPIASVSGTLWTGALENVPAGGPYRIEFRAAGATPVIIENVLVGDLWILAGQSNMEGVGALIDVQPPDPRVNTFDQQYQWGVAKEPLHSLPTAVDRVHWRGNNPPARLTGEDADRFNKERTKGAGLGLPFAVEMVKRTGIPIGLVPCAHGGTSMDQWSPALKEKGADSLYGAMFRRFEAVGGRVAGILWYQGEGDAGADAAPQFAMKFERFVTAVRTDFQQPDLAFYYVQLGRHASPASGRTWNIVQEAQRSLGGKLGKSGVVAAVDLSLDDGIHISTPGLKQLGVRLANLATQKAASPDVVSAQYSARTGILRVKFASVTGKLQSEGRMSGFMLVQPNGEPIPTIYKTEPDPADPSAILVSVDGKLPPNALLQYGYGRDPYCNLHDSVGMGVLVFGPMKITQSAP